MKDSEIYLRVMLALTYMDLEDEHRDLLHDLISYKQFTRVIVVNEYGVASIHYEFVEYEL